MTVVIIVEATIDSPIMREALRAAPETALVNEELYRTPGGIQHIFWAEGPDVDAFEAALESDPTVANGKQLVRAGDRRLYSVELTEYGLEVATYPVWREHNLTILDTRSTAEGWEVRFRFPDRAGVQGFFDACRRRDIPFVIDAIYSGSVGGGDSRLTPAQREALTTAHRVGYFEVPRSASLREVAQRLDISAQAASERIRRGMDALVAERLLDE